MYCNVRFTAFALASSAPRSSVHGRLTAVRRVPGPAKLSRTPTTPPPETPFPAPGGPRPALADARPHHCVNPGFSQAQRHPHNIDESGANWANFSLMKWPYATQSRIDHQSLVYRVSNPPGFIPVHRKFGFRTRSWGSWTRSESHYSTRVQSIQGVTNRCSIQYAVKTSSASTNRCRVQP